MDQQQEDELLMHVAAETDLLTAFAAVPRSNATQLEPPSAALNKTISRIVWGAIVIVVLTFCLIAIWAT